MERNGERYKFLKWGQDSFDNFRVVPPGTGICHQVNLEYLAQTVWTKRRRSRRTARPRSVEVAYPDSLVGTDSHTTMVNGLAVLGWGVGGIEAEACMLGQPLSMLLPEVIGFRLTGELRPGVTATDLVLTVTQMLRKRRRWRGRASSSSSSARACSTMTLADRATIGNMAPEYGATCGFFPVDKETHRPISPCRPTHRGARRAGRGLPPRRRGSYRKKDTPDPVFTDTLGARPRRPSCPSMAGPKRPKAASRSRRSAPGFQEALGSRNTRRPTDNRANATRSTAKDYETRPRRRRHRRDHLLHQHLEPERADRRRAARPQGGGKGLDLASLGQDLARARQPGRRRISWRRPACRRTSTSSAST